MIFKRRNVVRAPEPVIAGYLDRFGNGRLVGWAADRNDPAAHLRVTLRYKGQPIQERIADIERKDVNDTGIAGDHGFVLVLSTAVPRTCTAGDLELYATSGDASFRLPGVAMEDICAFLRHENASGEIVPCDAVWGAELNLADPTIGIHHDAVYLPFRPHSFLDATKHWGVYGSDGRLIGEAAYRRGSDLGLVGQSEALDLAEFDIEDAPFETMIYGGPIIAHYGHFILTSLARLWALDGSYPALFHSDPLIHDHQTPFIRTLFDAAGVTPHNSFSFNRPTRIKTLLVPEPALVEQNGISAHYATATASLARRIPMDAARWDKVYISKQMLTSGVTRLEGEDYVAQTLSDAGYQIAFPEQMSVAEQVNLFRKARLIVGTAGSAFHTQAFARHNDGDRIVLSYDSFVSSNFKLLDKVFGGTTHYRSISRHVERVEQPDFQIGYALRNASYFADELIALAEVVGS